LFTDDYDVNPALRSPHPFAAPPERYTLLAEALSYPNAPGSLCMPLRRRRPPPFFPARR